MRVEGRGEGVEVRVLCSGLGLIRKKGEWDGGLHTRAFGCGLRVWKRRIEG